MSDVRTKRIFSIRAWLTAVVTAAIVPLAFFGLWLANVEYQRTQSAAKTQLENVSRALLQAVEREFEHREGTLLTLAASPALRRGDFTEFYKIAESVVARMPATSGIILADESGQQIINTRRPLGAALPKRGDLTPVKKVFETKKSWVSDLFTGALMNIPVVGIDIPVLEGDKVIYNLALSVPIPALDNILLQQRLPETWIAVIFDRSGTIVSRSHNTEEWIGKKIPTSLGIDATGDSTEGFARGKTPDGSQYVSAWSRSSDWGWSVAISQPESEIRAGLIPNLAALMLSGALAIFLGTFLAGLLSSRISNATLGLAASAAQIGTAEYQKQELTGIKEVDSVNSRLAEASQLLRDRDLQRNAAEDHQRLLTAELDHRVKNILATVQALARQTFGTSPESKSFSGRVLALAQAHNLLATTRWRGATIRQIVETTLSAHGDAADRIMISGPELLLDPKSTQSFCLILHELCVNATKYGALSQADGRLQVEWEAAVEQLRMRWSEKGVATVSRPVGKGFGSRLIDLCVADLEGTIERVFDETGFSCRIEWPIRNATYVTGYDNAETDTLPANSGRLMPLLDGKRILIVEDSSLISDDLARALAELGAKVIGPANSVQSALMQLKGHELDCAVLDVNLNGQLVFSVADELQKRNIPFCFITGYGDPYVWPSHLQGIPKLMKPVHNDEVIKLVRLILASSQTL